MADATHLNNSASVVVLERLDGAMPMDVQPRQLSLDDLAAVANGEHRRCEAAIGSALQHAIASGQALIEAKARLKHGEWLPWLAEHFEGSARIARAYMMVALNWQRVANSQPVASALDANSQSLRAALRLLAAPDGKHDSKPHVANNSGENEWYTPDEYVGAARAVLGTIDLDPASSASANEIIRAQDFYTADDNGLAQPWRGRLWMNPPYASGLIEPFTAKMAECYEAGDVAESITLVNNATETRWFQRLARVAAAICFPERRIRFVSLDGTPGAPLQGQAFIYLGVDAERFANEYRKFGLIVDVRHA
jgi:ParB family chromosome partitioning protein